MITKSQDAFIAVYGQIGKYVGKLEMHTYFLAPNNNNNSQELNDRIEDAWCLWKAARNGLEIDLIAAIEQITDTSDDEWVYGKHHSFLIKDKITTLGYTWGLVPIEE